MPLLVGVTNAGKSTVLDPIDSVFSPEKVFHTPALGSSMPLVNLATKEKRFIYLDDFQPVAFASQPDRSPTVPVITFLKLFSGQHLEVQLPLNSHSGNADLAWHRGAAITCKLKGLWDTQGCVTVEDVRHMQSRVDQFEAHEKVPAQQMKDTKPCAKCFAKWLVEKSSAFAARSVPLPLAEPPVVDQPAAQAIEGLASVLLLAKLPPSVAAALGLELHILGAVHVGELGPGDWRQLPCWTRMRLFEQRRLACPLGWPHL